MRRTVRFSGGWRVMVLGWCSSPVPPYQDVVPSSVEGALGFGCGRCTAYAVRSVPAPLFPQPVSLKQAEQFCPKSPFQVHIFPSFAQAVAQLLTSFLVNFIEPCNKLDSRHRYAVMLHPPKLVCTFSR